MQDLNNLAFRLAVLAFGEQLHPDGVPVKGPVGVAGGNEDIFIQRIAGDVSFPGILHINLAGDFRGCG